MKRLYAAFVCVVLLLTVPTGVSAQGFPGGYPYPGAGGFPACSAGNACASSACTRSEFWGMPSLYAGWLEHPTGNSWALRRQTATETTTGTASWPLKGFWLEADKDVTLSNGYGFLLSGGIFLPQREHGLWVLSPQIARTFAFDIPSYDWWKAEVLVKRRMSGHFEVLAGLRWNHISTRVNYSDSTKDDYLLNAYIPIIGVQVNQPFSTGSLLVRFVGSPLVRGTLRYHFWTGNGYSESADFGLTDSFFMEFFASYGVKFRSDLNVGAFVRWNSLEARTAVHNLSGSTADPVSWNVDTRSWTFGGTASWAFGCPF